MRLLKRAFTFEKLSLFLVLIAVLIIPIERKYDKAFRFFSKTLIADGSPLPGIFDRRISYYPNEWIALALVAIALFGLRTSIREFFFEKTRLLLGAMFGFALLSLATGPHSHQPLVYIGSLHWIPPFIFFAFLATRFSGIGRDQIAHLVLWAIVAVSVFEASVAIAQYFHQESLGLRFLNEIDFNPEKIGVPSIFVPDGNRWIFDRLFSRVGSTTNVIRSTGTMPHPNFFGGFLFFSIMASNYFLSRTKKWGKWALSLAILIQCFALLTTYSRSAIFALVIGLGVWFLLHLRSSKIRWTIVTPVASLLLCGFLLSEQYFHRGGVVSYTETSKGSDNVRIYYQNLSLQMIRDRPLFGVGHQLFATSISKYDPTSIHRPSGVHNIYLLLASETGLFSLAAFLIWIGLIGRAFFKSEKDSLSITLFSIFLGFLFIGLCDFYPLAFHQGRMIFFLVAGLLYARKNRMTEPLQVTKMFDQISPTYDKINRILSLGMDMRWRKKAAKHLPKKGKLHLLDLATGTADQLISLFESKAPIASAIGLDLASEMLAIGERKIEKKSYAKQIELQVGDAMAIPFEADLFDACTFSFGIRNVKDPLHSLEEIRRVLKTGGRCLVLEFSIPSFPFKAPYLFYLRNILPWLGGKISRKPEAYHYLNRTIESFPSGKAFLHLMNRAGFTKATAHPMAFGAVTLYVGEKT